MTNAADYSLAELLVVAASEAWRDNGEVLASGIGIAADGSARASLSSRTRQSC